MTATGTFGGTCHFMPREQLTHFKYTRPVSDVWSIAATFYNMIVGLFPREAPGQSNLIEIVLNKAAVPIRWRDPAISNGPRRAP
jgi:serine/threonine protein kinase